MLQPIGLSSFLYPQSIWQLKTILWSKNRHHNYYKALAGLAKSLTFAKVNIYVPQSVAMSIKQLLTILAVFVFGNLAAQTDTTGDAWDLQKCISYALEHNLDISQQQLDENISQNNYLQSKLALLPTANASISNGLNFGRSIDISTYQYVNQRVTNSNYSLNANLTMFNGLRQLNSIQSSKYTNLSNHYKTESTKNTVLLSVTQAYLSILMNQESVKSSQEQAQISVNQLAHTKILFEAGTIPEGEYLKADAQLANDSLNLVIAQNSLELSRVTLALLLQVDPETFKVSTPAISDVIPLLQNTTADSIYNYAVTNQPQIVSGDYALKAAQKSISLAKGLQSPTISLYGSLGSNYSSYSYLGSSDPYFKQLNNNFNQGVGINISIPILNGWQTRTGIKNAKVDLLKTQATQQQTKDQLKKDIYTAFTDAKSASEKYRATAKSVQSLQTSFDYAQNLFDLGASNALDYSTAKSNLAVAQLNMINAKYEYLFKLKVLDFYQGKPITLNP